MGFLIASWSGQTRHKVLHNEDLGIRTQNERFQKAQYTRVDARARLAGLQDGTSAYAKAKKALARAELAYKRAVEDSIERIGSGSGKVTLVLPAGQRAVLPLVDVPSDSAVFDMAIEPSHVDRNTNMVEEPAALEEERQEVAVEQGEQGRGKRMRFMNKWYGEANYNMHHDSDSE